MTLLSRFARRARAAAITLLVVLAWLLAGPTQADVLWDLRDPIAPETVPAGAHIRIGTVSGPWGLMRDYFGRPALCSGGWYLEHRTAATADHGWTNPTIGTDDGGICAAVREPAAAPPPIEDDPATLEGAFASLAQRIDAERNRRITAAVGSLEEQLARLARSQSLQARIAAGTATEGDRTELALLLGQADYVEQLRLYAVTPSSPPMWIDPLPAAQTLYGWAEGTLGTAAAVEDIDPAAPPVDAPQWPQPQP